jgi:hypothetical protein
MPKHTQILGRKPDGKIVDHAWKKTGFRKAEQESQHAELQWRAHEHHAGRQHAPGQHDAGDSLAGPDADEQQIGRAFEQRVRSMNAMP